LVVSLVCLVLLPHCSNLNLNRLGLVSLWKCPRVLIPVSSWLNFLSSFLPLAPSDSDLAGCGRHANRVMVPLDWSDSYLCRVQMLSLFWTLPEILFPTYCLLPFTVKKIDIMIPPLRSGYYQRFFTSLPTHSPIIEFSHVLIYCLDNLQSSVCLGKYGIMTMSSRGGYRLFLNLVNPSASSVEHLFKSSDALFARAAYDHLVVEDFAKLAFMVESDKASTDFSILVIFFKNFTSLWKTHEALSLFLCIIFASLCMNLPLFEV